MHWQHCILPDRTAEARAKSLLLIPYVSNSILLFWTEAKTSMIIVELYCTTLSLNPSKIPFSVPEHTTSHNEGSQLVTNCSIQVPPFGSCICENTLILNLLCYGP